MGRLGAGPPYDKGKGQITIGASPKLPIDKVSFYESFEPFKSLTQ